MDELDLEPGQGIKPVKATFFALVVLIVAVLLCIPAYYLISGRNSSSSGTLGAFTNDSPGLKSNTPDIVSSPITTLPGTATTAPTGVTPAVVPQVDAASVTKATSKSASSPFNIGAIIANVLAAPPSSKPASSGGGSGGGSAPTTKAPATTTKAPTTTTKAPATTTTSTTTTTTTTRPPTTTTVAPTTTAPPTTAPPTTAPPTTAPPTTAPPTTAAPTTTAPPTTTVPPPVITLPPIV